MLRKALQVSVPTLVKSRVSVLEYQDRTEQDSVGQGGSERNLSFADSSFTD